MFAVRVLPLGGMTSVSISIKECNQLKAVAPSGEKKIDVSIFRPDGSGFNHPKRHMSMPARANSVRDTPCCTIFINQLGTTAFKPDCGQGPRLEGALEDSP